MIITVAGFKGGIGKTTTALHLAAFLAQESEHVLLVDADPNQSCLNWSKRGQLPFTVCSLPGLVKHWKGKEHTVFDTAGNPNREQLEEFAGGSDLVLFPTSADAMAIEALLNAIDSIKALESYGVVLTMIDSRKKATAEAARTALEGVGIPVYKQIIRRLTAYEKAALEGVPVNKVSDKFSNIAWGEYVALGQEILSNG